MKHWDKLPIFKVLRTKLSTCITMHGRRWLQFSKKRHSLKLQFADRITTWSLNSPTCTRYFRPSANSPIGFFPSTLWGWGSLRLFEKNILQISLAEKILRVLEIAAFPSVCKWSHLVLKYLYRSGNLKHTRSGNWKSHHLMMLLMAVESHYSSANG